MAAPRTGPQTGKLRAGLNWLFLSPFGQLLVLAVVSLILRIATFGHPNMDSDEAFYFLVGQMMHDGALPYVDVWDRKPLGLFILYYLIAAISYNVIAYQIAAWIFVALTAWVIALITREMASARGGLLAGLTYVTTLPLFFGWGGQAPVFYNLFVAAAVLLCLRAVPRLQGGNADRALDLAMLLCGLAITIKQTTLFESAFLGLFCLHQLVRSNAARGRVAAAALRWMALGALPTILISLYYWQAGHWAEYWHAMVSSNLAKKQASFNSLLARSVSSYLRIMPLLCAAAIGICLRAEGPNAGRHRRFLAMWIGAAAIGFLSVPNLYQHYMLPVLVPMSVAAGRLFSRRGLGLVFFFLLIATSLLRFNFFNFAYTRAAQSSLAHMERSIRTHGGDRGLLMFDGPVLMYPLTGYKPLSPLALPLHLNYEIERNVSHLDTDEEVRKALERRPGVVVIAGTPRNIPLNLSTSFMVSKYIEENCRIVDVQRSSEMFRTDWMLVYGDCHKSVTKN
jgi:hypothetical protein